MSGSLKPIRADVSQARREARGERIAQVEPALHAQQVIRRDGAARIAGSLPGRHRRRVVHLQFALADENAEQRVVDRLGRGPAVHRRVHAEAVGVALRHHAPVVHDDDRVGALGRAGRPARRRPRRAPPSGPPGPARRSPVPRCRARSAGIGPSASISARAGASGAGAPFRLRQPSPSRYTARLSKPPSTRTTTSRRARSTSWRTAQLIVRKAGLPAMFSSCTRAGSRPETNT